MHNLEAGGTLERLPGVACPRIGRRLWLICEFLLIFGALPVVVHVAVHTWRWPLFYVLPPVLLGLILYLLWDDTFKLARELAKGFSFFEFISILALFLVAGGCVAAYVAQEMPGKFLAFPKSRPEVWTKVMIAYPLLSVLAQELVFRTFFFHRYGPLFGRWRLVAILVNGLVFGWAHIVFRNPVAVVATTVMGVVFAYRYTETRSLWAVFLEHTLWGWLVFTVGLGGYFFTGVSNL